MVLEDLRINSAVGVWLSEHFALNHHLNGCLKLPPPPWIKLISTLRSDFMIVLHSMCLFLIFGPKPNPQ